MNALMPSLRGSIFTPAISAATVYEDPLDDDTSFDVPVTSTRRCLTRLALIAAETGARFQREGEGHDPMAWLLAPRRLFAGGAAIEAVLGREDFMRALLLHGLSIGLDADPGAIDMLADDGPEDDDEDENCDCGCEDCCCLHGDGDDGADASDPDAGADDGWHESAQSDRHGDRPDPGIAGRQLFTATLVHDDGGVMLQAFHASVCTDAEEAAERLAWRYGVDAASVAQVTAGFDPTTAFAEALVSPAVGHMLALVAAEPESPLAAGLDLNLEQRFAA